MIFESSLLLSGVTVSPGQLISIAEVLTGISFGAGQVTSITETLTGITFSAGRLMDNINPRIPPNVFTILFGINATQNLTLITIDKNDLTGLTPNNNNTTESLLVGLLCRNLTNSKKMQTPKIDIEYWGSGYTDDFRLDTVLVKVYNQLATTATSEISSYSSTVNPNNY